MAKGQSKSPSNKPQAKQANPPKASSSIFPFTNQPNLPLSS